MLLCLLAISSKDGLNLSDSALWKILSSLIPSLLDRNIWKIL
jgi:hypothetical protein